MVRRLAHPCTGVCGRNLEVARACAQKLLAVAGPERLLWGSDAPFVGHAEPRPAYGEALRLFEELVPDERQRHAIGLTALRLEKWPRRRSSPRRHRANAKVRRQQA